MKFQFGVRSDVTQFDGMCSTFVLAAFTAFGLMACSGGGGQAGPPPPPPMSPAPLPSVTPVSPSPSPSPTPVGAATIKHVVIIFQENRTPDNIFNGYPGMDTVTSGTNSHGQAIPLPAARLLRRPRSWKSMF